VPTNLVGQYIEEGSVARVEVSWTASTDDLGVAGYNVYLDGDYAATVFEPAYATELEAGQAVAVRVVAFDVERLFSPRSEQLQLPDVGNRAPIIRNLDDQFLAAGAVWEYVIAPSDPDGPVPGLLITGLPPGMQSQDNFDGTRTLRWRPLQPDVGTYAIRILVIDAADITLTRMYQFNVSVSLPDDLSTIPNLPPTIDAIDDYLVRAGDDLVMRVKAVDANGTIPALTLETDLAGATFEPFPSDERVRVLRWTLPAGEVGVREIEFRAEDADDAALVATRSVELDVRDPQSFSLPGERLRQLAPSSGIQIGYASLLGISSQADAGLYQAIAAAEFDLVTAENSMKWGYINPEPGRWRWDDADELVATARANE